MDIESLAARRAEFLTYCRVSKSLSANTASAYRQDLKEFETFCSAEHLGSCYDATLILRYVGYLEDQRGLKPASIRRRVACLRSFFKWLERTKAIGESPFRGMDLHLKVPRQLPRAVSRTQLREVLAAGGGTQSSQNRSVRGTTDLAIRLLVATGIRVGELTAIRLADVAGDGGAIRVLGKGKRERTVYVGNRRLREELVDFVERRQAARSDFDHLLLNQNGRPLSPQSLRLRLRKISEQLEISPRITPHRFRHTAATLLIEEGLDIRFVQRLLGHSSISTTEIYTHVSDRSLRTAIEGADTLEKLGI